MENIYEKYVRYRYIKVNTAFKIFGVCVHSNSFACKRVNSCSPEALEDHYMISNGPVRTN
jgi:hypothetical protein